VGNIRVKFFSGSIR